MKYLQTFENHLNEELFGLFGGKEKQTTPVDETDSLKSKINKVFPESIYGNYLNTLSKEDSYKLYQIIDNNSSVMNNSAFMDVMKGDESKRDEVDAKSVFWLKCLFSVIETGSFVDSKGQRFSYEFLSGKTETSLKQIMNSIRSKSDLIPELVKMSRETGGPIYKMIDKRF